MRLATVFARFAKLTADNSPVILTGFGVAGTIATAVLAGQASFKAARLLEEDKAVRKLAGEYEPATPKEIVRRVAPLYIPAVGTGALTIACIIASNRIGTRRAVAMAAAYSVSEKAFTEYRDKVVERLGQGKEQGLRDEIAQDQVDRNPVSTREVIITGAGKVLCMDSITGRYFESDMESLRKAQNDLNQEILHDSYAPLSRLYELIGIPSTPYSSEVGWNLSTMCELKFSAVLAEDGRPCISINYAPYPIREYY